MTVGVEDDAGLKLDSALGTGGRVEVGFGSDVRWTAFVNREFFKI